MNRIEFMLKPSKWLFFLQLSLHGLAFAALFCANIGLLGKGLGCLLLILSGYYQCWLLALQRGSRSIVGGIAMPDRWWLTDRLNCKYEVILAGEILVTTVLIILNFREIERRQRRFRLILAPDSVDFDTLRRLRVLLMHGFIA
ncbi:MAG: protein YgfX [Candidatus Neomarinimicrobiota bacterium]